MELDFSRLEKIAQDEAPKKTPTTTPQERIIEGGEYKTTTESESPPEAQKTAIAGLQREADQIKADHARCIEAYRTYQENIKRSDQLQSDILKGTQRGEGIYSLFLKAAKAISLMTSNALFYTQTEADIIAIYGEGLQEPEPLELELEAVEGRLQKLKQAAAGGSSDRPDNLAHAIRAHERKAAEIRKIIAKSGESVTA